MKKPFYCGTDTVVPKEYSRVGSPYECLRKGIGVGIMTSTPEKKIRMIKKTIEKNNPVKKDAIVKIATTLNVNVYDDKNKVMNKDEIIKKIIKALKKLEKEM